MSRIGHHVMLRTDDDRVLAPGDSERRALAEALYRVAGPFRLAAFAAADSHLHLVVLCRRDSLGYLFQRLASSFRLGLGLGAPLLPPRVKDLADQHHLVNAFHYTLDQRNRHGLHSDPFLDASSLPELLGLRLLPNPSLLLVREWLPRLTRRDLLCHLGPESLQPVPDELLVALLEQDRDDLLLDAAAGALALPDLGTRRPQVARARGGLARLLAPLVSPKRIAAALGRASSSVRRLRAKAPDPKLEAAIRLQVALRCWLLEHHPEVLDPHPVRLPEGPARPW